MVVLGRRTLKEIIQLNDVVVYTRSLGIIKELAQIV
jgi:hypothetical protein